MHVPNLVHVACGPHLGGSKNVGLCRHSPRLFCNWGFGRCALEQNINQTWDVNHRLMDDGQGAVVAIQAVINGKHFKQLDPSLRVTGCCATTFQSLPMLTQLLFLLSPTGGISESFSNTPKPSVICRTHSPNNCFGYRHDTYTCQRSTQQCTQARENKFPNMQVGKLVVF
eukprot:289548-Amphidinium_carterae.1